VSEIIYGYGKKIKGKGGLAFSDIQFNSVNIAVFGYG